MFYPYRTTVDKLVEAQQKITEAGDTVVSVHHNVGRDWVVLAREGQEVPSIDDEIAQQAQLVDLLSGRVRSYLDAVAELGLKPIDGQPSVAGPWGEATD